MHEVAALYVLISVQAVIRFLFMITINLCLQRFINFSVDILFSGAYGNRKAQVYRKNPIIIENVLSSSGFLYTKYGTKFSWFGSWSLLLLHERMWYLFEFSFVEKTVRVKIFQYLSRYNKEARRLHAVVSWLQTLVPRALDVILSDLISRLHFPCQLAFHKVWLKYRIQGHFLYNIPEPVARRLVSR